MGGMTLCCPQITIDWATFWTAILALATILIAMFAFKQLIDIKVAVKSYSVSTTLQQEYYLLNRKNEIEVKIWEWTSLLNSPGPYNKEISEVVGIKEANCLIEISNYLFSLDRYAYEVLTNKKEFNKGSILFFSHINNNLVKLFKLSNDTIESYSNLNKLLEQLRKNPS